MKYRAVVFDLDGTLLDTLRDLAESVNSVLSRSGFPEHSLEEYRRFVGDGVEDLTRRVLPEGHRDDATITRTMADVREEYRGRWPDHTRPYEGIPELLDALTARGVKMAVVTNKPDDSTRAMAAKLLPRWKFDAIVGAKPDLPKKPDPKGALDGCSALGVATGSNTICWRLGHRHEDGERCRHVRRRGALGFPHGRRTDQERRQGVDQEAARTAGAAVARLETGGAG